MMTQLSPCTPCRCIRRKIEASRCDLRVGDLVAPDTVLGADLETGEPVTAGCHGEVAVVHFSGGEHALEVIIRPRPA